MGDNPERLRAAVEIAKSRADMLITPGGVGPTCDDLTKQTLAACFDLPLEFHEEEAARIRAYFDHAIPGGVSSMTDNNLQQAYLPQGCTVLVNTNGTAPGCAFAAQGKHVLMLPGPPRECRAMLHGAALPYLRRLAGGHIVSHNIRVIGLGESFVEDKLRPLMLSLHNPTLAPYARTGEMSLRLTAKADTVDEAEALMAPILQQVTQMLGSYVYGIDVDTVEARVLALLEEQGKTLVAAESCTGGMLGERITAVPGASRAFLGSFVTYASALKTQVLGVPEALIAEKSAVSQEVALAMAQGARRLTGADIALAVTGYAGPVAQPDKSGLVYIAIAADSWSHCRQLHLGTDRERARIVACGYALDMARRYLTGTAQL